MKLAYKIWIDQNGKAFGDGPLGLLKGVEQTDSLHKAANRMGMSYSKAWRLIRTMEKRLGFPLLERKVGGLSGGGSNLTSQARELIVHYEQFRKEAKGALERLFRRHFGSPEKNNPKRRARLQGRPGRDNNKQA